MKLSTRLLLTFIAIAVLLAAPAIYALSRLTELRDIAGDQRTRHAYALMQHGELTTSVAELDRYEFDSDRSQAFRSRTGWWPGFRSSRTGCCSRSRPR